MGDTPTVKIIFWLRSRSGTAREMAVELGMPLPTVQTVIYKLQRKGRVAVVDTQEPAGERGGRYAYVYGWVPHE